MPTVRIRGQDVTWRRVLDRTTGRRLEAGRYLGLTIAVIRGDDDWGSYVQEPRALFRLVGYAFRREEAKAIAVLAADNWTEVRRVLQGRRTGGAETLQASLEAIAAVLGFEYRLAPRTGT